MLRLNCFIRVEDDKYEIVLEAARRLTEASLLQEGCVAYDIFRSATRPNVLMICETWHWMPTALHRNLSDMSVKCAPMQR